MCVCKQESMMNDDVWKILQVLWKEKKMEKGSTRDIRSFMEKARNEKRTSGENGGDGWKIDCKRIISNSTSRWDMKMMNSLWWILTGGTSMNVIHSLMNWIWDGRLGKKVKKRPWKFLHQKVFQ